MAGLFLRRCEGPEIGLDTVCIGVQKLLNPFGLRGSKDETDVVFLLHPPDQFGILVGTGIGFLLFGEGYQKAGIVRLPTDRAIELTARDLAKK